MARGGFFRGNQHPPTDEERANSDAEIKRYPAVVWGYVPRGGKVVYKPRPYANFTVKFGNNAGYDEDHKERVGRRFCEVWNDEDLALVSGALEPNDEIISFGEWKVVHYRRDVPRKSGKGKREDYHIFTCHFVLPMRLVAFAQKLYNSPKIWELLESDEQADPMESLED